MRGNEDVETLLRGPGAVNVALLRRGVPGFPELGGGDWDIAVRNQRDIGEVLESALGPPDLTISRRYVVQRFYPWNQVDLLPVFEWNGFRYLNISRFWAGVLRGDDGIPRPRLGHDAYIAWMTGALWGGTYKRKYDGLLKLVLAEDRVGMQECLTDAFGTGLAREALGWLEAGTPDQAAANAGRLRRALVMRSFLKRPVSTVASVARHWLRELKLHFRPPYPWVAFLGPDGSGKSAVIKGVTERMEARRMHVKMIHWSPRLIRKGAEVPGGIVPDPHSKPPRGALVSVAKLGLLAAEWWWGWLWFLRHPRAKDRWLFSDRYYNDLLVDPRRYRYGAPQWLARWCFKFFPKPDLVVILAGDPLVIHARKHEVALDELERQVGAYRELGARLGKRAVVLDAGRPLAEVVEEADQSLMRLSGSGALCRELLKEPGDGRRHLEVLVSAYACHPRRGAEANVAWNLVRELSSRHSITVITREFNRAGIEASGEAWVGNVRWSYLDPPAGWSFWRRGGRGVVPYYVWWQCLARRRARELQREKHADVIHHLTFGSYLMPSLLSGMGAPLLFGPVGGGELTPPGLVGHYRFGGIRAEVLRTLARWGIEYVGLMGRWYRSAAWNLAATPATHTRFKNIGIDRVSVMAQSATGGDAVERYARAHPRVPDTVPGCVKLVVASRLVHWKAVDLAIMAAAEARKGGLDVRLTILQEGPELPYLKRLVSRFQMDDVVEFTGKLEQMEEVFRRISEADGLIHPALHEAFGQACLESLALGVPVICLDWGGPGMIVDGTCGFKVKPGDLKATVEGLAGAIRELASAKAVGRDFIPEAKARVMKFQWAGMAEEIDRIYQGLARTHDWAI